MVQKKKESSTSVVLDKAEIQDALKKLPGWKHRKNKIRKKYSFEEFVNAFAFMNSILLTAEGFKHYPEVCISQSGVAVKLASKQLGGITTFDVLLAKKIEDLHKNYTR